MHWLWDSSSPQNTIKPLALWCLIVLHQLYPYPTSGIHHTFQPQTGFAVLSHAHTTSATSVEMLAQQSGKMKMKITNLLLGRCLSVWPTIVLPVLGVEGLSTVRTTAWDDTPPADALNKVCKRMHFWPVKWELFDVPISFRFTNFLIKGFNLQIAIDSRLRHTFASWPNCHMWFFNRDNVSEVWTWNLARVRTQASALRAGISSSSEFCSSQIPSISGGIYYGGSVCAPFVKNG